MSGGRSDGGGYTLAETLVALTIIGLTIGGLVEAGRVLGRGQESVRRTVAGAGDLRQVGQALNDLLDGEGPFVSTDPKGFDGAATAFTFDCGAPAPCGAWLTPQQGGMRLRLSDVGGAARVVALPGDRWASFTYGGTRTSGSAWPPAGAGPGGAAEAQTLRSIALVQIGPAGDTPIASIRLWTELPAACDFDAVVQACRGTAL